MGGRIFIALKKKRGPSLEKPLSIKITVLIFYSKFEIFLPSEFRIPPSSYLFLIILKIAALCSSLLGSGIFILFSGSFTV